MQTVTVITFVWV